MKNELNDVTLYDLIKEFVDEFGEKDLVREEKFVVYRSSKDKEKFFTDLNEAFEQRLNLAEYEKKTEIKSNRKDALKALFGGAEKSLITKEERKVINQFFEKFQELDLSKVVRPDKKERTFQQKIAAINNKITTEKDDVKESALRVERAKLYIEHGITPRSTYKDMDIYNELLNKK